MNVDFVPFVRGVHVLRKLRLIFSRINGPNMLLLKKKTIIDIYSLRKRVITMFDFLGGKIFSSNVQARRFSIFISYWTFANGWQVLVNKTEY